MHFGGRTDTHECDGRDLVFFCGGWGGVRTSNEMSQIMLDVGWLVVLVNRRCMEGGASRVCANGLVPPHAFAPRSGHFSLNGCKRYDTNHEMEALMVSILGTFHSMLAPNIRRSENLPECFPHWSSHVPTKSSM